MILLALVLAVAGHPVFTFADPAIIESSGLVDQGGLMFTINDSGGEPIVYAVDPRSGATVGRTRYAAEAVDVEALAPAGRGRVWVGDIGDNGADRDHLSLYRVPVGRGERSVEATEYRLAYPDGPRDAESLVSTGGRLFVIAKGVFGGGVYAAPRRLDASRVNRLSRVGSVSVFATDAAMFAGGRYALIRGYGTAEVRELPGWRKVAGFDLPAQEQGEGVSVGPGNRVRLSSEGAGSAVLQIDLPPRVRQLLRSPPADGGQTMGGAPDARGEMAAIPTWLWLGALGFLGLLLAGSWVAMGRRRR